MYRITSHLPRAGAQVLGLALALALARLADVPPPPQTN